MISSGNMMKSVLVAVVLMTLTESGLAAEKLASCCERVTRGKITDPISGFLVQKESVLPCIDAVILQTEKGLFCIHPKAPWLSSKIQAYMKDKRQRAAAPSASPSPSHVSLLSMITSSAPRSSSSAPHSSSSAPPSSSSAPPSSSSTAEMPVGGNVSDQME